MSVPVWAQNMVIDVCIREGAADIPEVVWRHSPSHPDTSGHCKSTCIVITAGRDRVDQKLILLHELAHYLIGPEKWHSDSFWDLAWKLYRQARLPIRYCLKRERAYRKGAVAAYHRGRYTSKDGQPR